MGVHTQGSLSAELSRELSDDELEAWEARVKAGRQGPGPCAHPNHEGAPLDPETGKCRNHGTPLAPGGGGGHCWADSARFDPEGWMFDDDSAWGDVGIARLGRSTFEVEAGGKVYDLFDGVAFIVECLPPDVTAEGDGMFDSDGVDWAIAIRGREVRELQASVIVEGDAAPTGTVVWVLGHVNFVGGDIATRVYSSEHDARIAYGEELVEHLDVDDVSELADDPDRVTNIGERADAPWVAHFVADGECVTWLDRMEVS